MQGHTVSTLGYPVVGFSWLLELHKRKQMAQCPTRCLSMKCYCCLINSQPPCLEVSFFTYMQNHLILGGSHAASSLGGWSLGLASTSHEKGGLALTSFVRDRKQKSRLPWHLPVKILTVNLLFLIIAQSCLSHSWWLFSWRFRSDKIIIKVVNEPPLKLRSTAYNFEIDTVQVRGL